MKIGLVSSYVPFIFGGYRNIVDWLEAMLLNAGHQVEKIYLPELDQPDHLFKQMFAFRWVDLRSADRVICFRPLSYLVPHHHKIVWFIHHIRAFYDLWESQYREFPDDPKHRGIRDALRKVDSAALLEARKIFTNSQVVSNRLKKYNNIESEVLYPPVFRPERFHCTGYSDEILCISRLEHHKRQHLLIDAMQYVQTPVRLRLSGTSASHLYPFELRDRISRINKPNSIHLDERWITEEEKVEQLSQCLAVAYLPLDEDSYGYPSIEASCAKKPILTTSDSGGVLELVEDGCNGYVSGPNPKEIAHAMDRLYLDRLKTAQMGGNALERIRYLNISWEYVIERLTE